MRSSMLFVAVLVAMCAARPSAAFFQDLLMQPLQHIQHVMQPQPPQPPQPQYYQYQQYPQYRRSEPQPQPQPLPAAVPHGVYSNYPRAAVYQYQQQPGSYGGSYGSGYSYGSNPLSSLLQGVQQGSWLPWASRQPAVQQVQVQPQSAPVVAVQHAQPQQPQQPLQAFWALLPWNSNSQPQQLQQQQQPGPILSFLQNPAAALPWNQQASRPNIVYTTPLAPSSASSASFASAHEPAGTLSAVPVSASLTAAAAPATAMQVESIIKPTGVVLDDIPTTMGAFAGNEIRRIALHDVQDVHADGLPCAQDA